MIKIFSITLDYIDSCAFNVSWKKIMHCAIYFANKKTKTKNIGGDKTFIKVNTGSTTAVIHYLYMISKIIIAQLNIHKQLYLYLIQCSHSNYALYFENLWMRHSRGVHSSTTRVTYTLCLPLCLCPRIIIKRVGAILIVTFVTLCRYPRTESSGQALLIKPVRAVRNWTYLRSS